MDLPLDELRPLVCAVSYPDGEGVSFLLDDREVRLDGDRDFIGGVLGLCDGRLSVAQIAERVGGGADADVLELVGALHEQGVLLDCSQAWRRFDEQSSTRSRLYRPVTEELMREIVDLAPRPAAEPLRSVALEPRPTRLGELAAARRRPSASVFGSASRGMPSGSRL
jgi:hypothetical protein